MGYRIESIEIYNFKLFEKSFTLPVNRKNVLLFGENGSGKSSIYWSFYTHYQAVYKPQDDARKYFIHGHKNTLRNKFTDEAAHSGIKVTFKDDNNGTHEVEDSDEAQSVLNLPEKNLMLNTAKASDFLNYKSLSSIFDFTNSEENELFDVFEKEILQFLSLQNDLILEGINKGNDALTWWQYINSEYKNLPRNRKNYNDFNQNAQEYRSYMLQLRGFNDDMRTALSQLIISANQLLQGTFNIPVALTVRYENAKFNERIPNTHRSRDRKVTAPKIILNAKMVHPDIANQDVRHPSSFFNEAKLSCMALALRLAVLNRKPTEGVGYASALFVDDLLNSLDMGYRRKVVEILLDSAINRQLLFFTHDRALTHIVKEEISIRGKNDDWAFYELYADEVNGHPEPVLIQPRTPIEEAKAFFYEHRIAACANALRRACEKQLRRLLPYSMQLKKDPQDLSASPLLDLNGMIGNFEKLRKQMRLPDIAHGISTDRKLLLNPFSHDDIDTPFYKTELERLIACCEELAKIERKDLVDDAMVHSEVCRIEVNNGAYQAVSTFTFVEKMLLFRYGGNDYYTNARVKIITTTADNRYVDKVKSLSILYADLYNSVSLNATTCPKLRDVLFKADGTLLINV